MGGEFAVKPGATSLVEGGGMEAQAQAPGKRTLAQGAGHGGTRPQLRGSIGRAFGVDDEPATLAQAGGAHLAERVGVDPTAVHVHEDGVAEGMGARAVARGTDVHVAKGALQAPDAEFLLSHELAHVVQQGQGQPARATDHRALEAEADRVGSLVAGGGSARGTIEGRATPGSAQKFESREHAELGDQVHSAVGATAAASSAETGRLAKDAFIDNQRSLSLELRVRDAQTGLPSVGGTQSVPLSYGEMIALSGDFYFSVDNLRKAPAQEVTTIRDLVAEERRDPKGRDFDTAYEAATAWRREGVYKPGTGENEGTKGQYFGVQPGDKGHDEASTYLDLATENNAHFSAETGAIAVPDGPEGNAATNNHQGWLTDHSRAITLAKRVRELKRNAGLLPGGTPPTPAPATSASGAKVEGGDSNDVTALENLAYIYNSGGDHYLTDAFSAGHLINKALLSPITDKVLDETMFETMVEALLPYAMKEPAVLGISANALGAGGGAVAGAIAGLFVGGPLGMIIGGVGGGFGGHAGMKAIVRRKLRAGLSVFKTDPNLRHNVGAKLVHDWLNTHGGTVTSRNGRFHYTTMGDGTMDAVTKDIAARAVLASRNYIRALMSDSDADLGQPQNTDDAWEYTPNVDVTLLTARAEPMLRGQLANTVHLWELMKTAVKVKEDRAKQDETEKSTASSAKADNVGAWGQQPNSRFTRRMIVSSNQ